MEDGITGHEQNTSALDFDEFDSNIKVKELSSLMKKILGRYLSQSLVMTITTLV